MLKEEGFFLMADGSKSTDQPVIGVKRKRDKISHNSPAKQSKRDVPIPKLAAPAKKHAPKGKGKPKAQTHNVDDAESEDGLDIIQSKKQLKGSH